MYDINQLIANSYHQNAFVKNQNKQGIIKA